MTMKNVNANQGHNGQSTGDLM